MGEGQTRQSGRGVEGSVLGEGDACGAVGDNIDTLAAVVGKGWAKGESAIPVRGPSVAVVGTVKGKTELAGGVKGMGREVVWEMV